MRRIKIIKSNEQYKEGETVEVTPNIAHGLIDRGLAILTKDIVSSDIKTKKVKRGRSTKLRTYNGS